MDACHGTLSMEKPYAARVAVDVRIPVFVAHAIDARVLSMHPFASNVEATADIEWSLAGQFAEGWPEGTAEGCIQARANTYHVTTDLL